MNIDRRFAIIIGINDYVKKPLEYCVDDALAVAKILEDKCAFKNGDIYVITSDSKTPKKDISGHLDDALKKISKDLKPQVDSICFYFAGHGEYHFENSGLLFHDSIVEIGDIFNRINGLEPKYQCYVIDACESGGKVLTRGTSEPDLIEKYISKSSGVLFMYAATENEKAKEVSKIKHGLFTYYFLDAINNDSNYDSEGILTPNRIQVYIARETSKESEFKQTPVIENRTIGYYPFAFKEKPKEPIVMTKVGKERNVADEASSIDKIYFPEIPNEIRQQVFAELTQSFISAKDKWFSVLKLDEYDITIGENLSIFNRSLSDSLTDSIAIKSRNENIEAVSNLFSLDRVENTPNPVSGMFSIIDALTQKKQPKYTYFNNIQWGDERIISFSINLKSKNIYKVSCGLVVVVYQA